MFRCVHQGLLPRRPFDPCRTSLITGNVAFCFNSFFLLGFFVPVLCAHSFFVSRKSISSLTDRWLNEGGEPERETTSGLTETRIRVSMSDYNSYNFGYDWTTEI